MSASAMSDKSGMPSDEAIPAVPFGSILGVCSLLHEATPAGRPAWNSSAALLQGKPVVRRTVERLSRIAPIEGVAVLCWDEQVPELETALENTNAQLIPHGPTRVMPGIQAVAAAQAWADGWRGGLLRTVPQDRGFLASTTAAVARAVGADGLFLVDGSFALLDVELCGSLIKHATSRPGHDLYFTAAAPGLAGLLISAAHAARLAETDSHPGAALHYDPQRPCVDPLAADYCFHASFQLSRTLHDFRVDDDQALAIAERALANDETIAGIPLLESFDAATDSSQFQELTIELTTSRQTSPNWLNRAESASLDLTCLKPLLDQALAENRQLRLTFGRFGDPLCHPNWREAVMVAREAGVISVHLETDLLCETADIAHVAAMIDLVSVHLPAVTAQTYERVMGIDAYERVTRNLAYLLAFRQQKKTGLPLIVPTFIKTVANLDEMEPWYDGWLEQAGSAVIRGPDACDNIPPADVVTARMIRSERRPGELLVTADGQLRLGRARLDSISTLDSHPLRNRLKSIAPQVVARDKEAA